jgi:hypothetical protein
MTHVRLRGRSARSGLPACLALLVGLVLVACGGQIPFGTPRAGGPATSAAPTPAGTDAGGSVPGFSPPTSAVTYRIAKAALSLTLPPGWVGYDAASPDALLDAAARDHPELRQVFDLLQRGQLSFVALDASATGEGQPASMTIASLGNAIPPGPALEQFAEQVAGSIRNGQPMGGEVALEPVALGSGEAYNLRWQIARTGGAEPLGLDAYVLSLPERTYLVTFSAPASEVDGFQPAFRRIVGSMTPLAP